MRRLIAGSLVLAAHGVDQLDGGNHSDRLRGGPHTDDCSIEPEQPPPGACEVQFVE